MDNYQARAYAVLALAELGYSLEEIQKVKGKMMLMMDLNSEEEAEKKAEIVLNKLESGK